VQLKQRNKGEDKTRELCVRGGDRRHWESDPVELASGTIRQRCVADGGVKGMGDDHPWVMAPVRRSDGAPSPLYCELPKSILRVVSIKPQH
jgi:hypothetical protein